MFLYIIYDIFYVNLSVGSHQLVFTHNVNNKNVTVFLNVKTLSRDDKVTREKKPSVACRRNEEDKKCAAFNYPLVIYVLQNR